MNINEQYTDFIVLAQAAEGNGQYEKAAAWLQQALDADPASLEALSMLGRICVNLKMPDEALAYFTKAVELAPDNGDNWYNLGNAFLFSKNLTGAYQNFMEAERRGVSKDVQPHLYFQLAVLFGMKNSYATALYYIGKCEMADPTGSIALSPDLLSEKVKLYLSSGDVVSAEKYSVDLIGVDPRKFTSYMTLCTIQMSRRNYKTAWETLMNAQKFAEISGDDKITLTLYMSSILQIMAEVPGTSDTQKAVYVRKAVDGLRRAAAADATVPQYNQLMLALAEIYQKNKEYKAALEVLNDILEYRFKGKISAASGNKALDSRDMESYIESLWNESEDWSEDQPAVRMFGEQKGMDDEKNPAVPVPNTFGDPNFMDRMRFVLINCQTETGRYKEAEEVAAFLKHSTNTQFAYYGIYIGAMCARMNRPDDTTGWKRAYAEAIAYFKNRMIRNPSDSLALVFRARLHAECGNFANAEELASLLAEEDRKSVLVYIEKCKKQH